MYAPRQAIEQNRRRICSLKETDRMSRAPKQPIGVCIYEVNSIFTVGGCILCRIVRTNNKNTT